MQSCIASKSWNPQRSFAVIPAVRAKRRPHRRPDTQPETCMQKHSKGLQRDGLLDGCLCWPLTSHYDAEREREREQHISKVFYACHCIPRLSATASHNAQSNEIRTLPHISKWPPLGGRYATISQPLTHVSLCSELGRRGTKLCRRCFVCYFLHSCLPH